jgi:hypothetical protein
VDTAAVDTAVSAERFVLASLSPLNRKPRSRERGFLAQTVWAAGRSCLFSELLTVCGLQLAGYLSWSKSTIRDGSVHRNRGHELFPAGGAPRKPNPSWEERNRPAVPSRC